MKLQAAFLNSRGLPSGQGLPPRQSSPLERLPTCNRERKPLRNMPATHSSSVVIVSCLYFAINPLMAAVIQSLLRVVSLRLRCAATLSMAASISLIFPCSARVSQLISSIARIFSVMESPLHFSRPVTAFSACSWC